MVLGGQKMKLFTFAIGSALILALSFSFIGISKAGPVELETDAGVITMVATVEKIDVDNQLVTDRTAIPSWSRSSPNTSR